MKKVIIRESELKMTLEELAGILKKQGFLKGPQRIQYISRVLMYKSKPKDIITIGLREETQIDFSDTSLEETLKKLPVTELYLTMPLFKLFEIIDITNLFEIIEFGHDLKKFRGCGPARYKNVVNELDYYFRRNNLNTDILKFMK